MKKSIHALFGGVFIVAAMLTGFSSAWAANGSYNAEVAIASKSDVDRTKALAEAYKQVISNLSKNPKIMNSPEVRSKLKNLNMWVQSYSYTKHLATNGQLGLFLKVTFDPQSIPEQLRSTDMVDNPDESASIGATNAGSMPDGDTAEAMATTAVTTHDVKNVALNTSVEDAAPISVTSNVDVLVWLATIGDNAKTNVIVDDTHSKPIANSLENIAQKVGFSLTLPTMDLQDIAKITADDVCDQDINVLKNASNRYGIDKIAAGCIIQTDNGKRGQWLLLVNSKVYHWDIKGNDEAEILRRAFGSMAKVLMPTKTIKLASAIASSAVPNADTAHPPKQNNVNQPVRQSVAANVLNSDVGNAAKIQQPIPIQKIAPNTSLLPPQPATAPKQTAAPIFTAPASPTTTTASNPASPTAHTTDNESLKNPNQVILYVNNINNLDQYASAVQYVHTIAGTEKVELLNISLSTIKLKISIKGGRNALLNGLNAQHKLTPSANNSSTSSDSENNAALNYSWTPSTS